MMRILLPLLTAAAVLPLTQCVVEVPESGTATQVPENGRGENQQLSADKGAGSVTIRDKGRVVTSIRTAMPNVEETRWHKGKSEIAVKSRGSHGPATVELFNSRTGAKLGTVMAYELASGGPEWARAMAE